MRLVALLLCSVFAFGQSPAPSPRPTPQLPKSSADQNHDFGLGIGAQGQQHGALEILSDTKGVDFGPYLKSILKKVRENWYSLIPERAAMKKGKLAIEFAITKDGKIADMRLVATSGDVALDRAAWGGIYTSSPFPELPSEFTGPYLALRFRFYYNPDKSDLGLPHDGNAPPNSSGTDSSGKGCSVDPASATDQVRLSEILISTPRPDDPARVADARQKAEQVRAAIGRNGTFADIARADSQGPSAAWGGDLGCFHHGDLAKPLDELVFRMKVGDVSDVLRTKQGFVILEVSGRCAGACAAKVVVVPSTTSAVGPRWDKGVVEGGTYKNASVGLEVTPAMGLEFGTPELKGNTGTVPLLVTITAVSAPKLFSGRDVMAFYADALAYYPENQRSTEAYLRKVVQGNQKEGFEPLSGSSEIVLDGTTFARQDFQKESRYEGVLVKACKPQAIVFIFAASDRDGVNKLIESTRVKLDLERSGCGSNVPSATHQ